MSCVVWYPLVETRNQSRHAYWVRESQWIGMTLYIRSSFRHAVERARDRSGSGWVDKRLIAPWIRHRLSRSVGRLSRTYTVHRACTEREWSRASVPASAIARQLSRMRRPWRRTTMIVVLSTNWHLPSASTAADADQCHCSTTSSTYFSVSTRLLCYCGN